VEINLTSNCNCNGGCDDNCSCGCTEQDQILDIFKETGALLEGHFLLTSGRHSAQYMQCAQVLQYPGYASALGEKLADRFKGYEIKTVIGPAMGGIIVAHEVGSALNKRVIFAERQNGEMCIRRGFKLAEGEKVLVVEDVITTGGSVKEVISIVKECGAIPVGVGVLVNRSGGTADFDGLPLESLVQLNIETFEPDNCPLCAKGIPAVKPGSRGNK